MLTKHCSVYPPVADFLIRVEDSFGEIQFLDATLEFPLRGLGILKVMV